MTDRTVTGLRLEEGAILPDAALRAAREHGSPFCDVSGFGEVEWVELASATGETTRHTGPFELLDFKGRVRQVGGTSLSDFVCTVSRRTDNGIELLGGRLVRAGVRFAEIAFTPLAASEAMAATGPEDLVPRGNPAPEDATLRFAVEEKRSIDRTVREALAVDERWERAIAESERVQQEAAPRRDSDDGSDIKPRRGDVVMHRQFGRCTVLRIDDDHITLRKPDQRNVQLGLGILAFFPEGKEGKAAVFRVEVRRRSS